MTKLTLDELESDQQNLVEKTDIDVWLIIAKNFKRYEEEIEQLEEAIKIQKEKKEKISSEIIPNILAEQGLSSLKLADGSSIDVRKNIDAPLKKMKWNQLTTGFEKTDWMTSLKMRSLYSLEKAKTQEHRNYCLLQG